jgi:hypothetical protein
MTKIQQSTLMIPVWLIFANTYPAQQNLGHWFGFAAALFHVVVALNCLFRGDHS